MGIFKGFILALQILIIICYSIKVSNGTISTSQAIVLGIAISTTISLLFDAVIEQF